MDNTFEYAKQKWEKSHKAPELKVGYLVLVSTLNLKNIQGTKKLEYFCVGSFVIVSLHRTKSVQVGVSGQLENKHPTFSVSLIKSYQQDYTELFPLRNLTLLTVTLVEQNEESGIKKFIKERRLRGQNQIKYLVRYRNTVHENDWLAESDIPDPDKHLRRFSNGRRPKASIFI
ncbi:hypothetical protein O181_011203 [Austropuccinia psidii MF-1]|uniref:Chromo domain-containing protein n=1 Tax=Austropuccinia psidii MF-1 TaxID=1389203 RepID=A0A9Q3GL31_9BASI|nr:hypothetical protein [Austropuccinia psidii MF-1]